MRGFALGIAMGLTFLALVFAALTLLSGCTHTVAARDVHWCLYECGPEGVLEVGRKVMSEKRCCKCADGRTIFEEDLGEDTAGVSVPSGPY